MKRTALAFFLLFHLIPVTAGAIKCGGLVNKIFGGSVIVHEMLSLLNGYSTDGLHNWHALSPLVSQPYAELRIIDGPYKFNVSVRRERGLSNVEIRSMPKDPAIKNSDGKLIVIRALQSIVLGLQQTPLDEPLHEIRIIFMGITDKSIVSKLREVGFRRTLFSILANGSLAGIVNLNANSLFNFQALDVMSQRPNDYILTLHP